MNRYYVRKFLNRRGHYGGAYIMASVREPAFDFDDIYVEASLEISDCSRRISLDFPLYSKSARSNSLYKARLLAEITARFAEELEVQAEEAVQQEAMEGRNER